MSALDRKVKSLQRRHSKAHVFFLVFILGAVLAIMIGVRSYVIEPVRVQDNSLYPKFKKNSILWMCKLPRCTDDIKDGDFVWGILRNQDNMVRRVLGGPGDSITITNNGKVYTPHRNFKWNGEDAFIETRSIYIPRKGDTLRFNKLNDVEQDYLISLMHEQNEKIYVKSSLWQGNREMPIERIGSTKLGNRQVSLQEVDYLPWQDRYLLEEQIFHTEPGDSPIQIRREFYDEIDSSKITEIVVPEDCYFLACTKGAFCLDSREVGYFTKSHIRGRYVKEPRIAINTVRHFVRKALAAVMISKKKAKKEAAQPESDAQPQNTNSTKN